MLKWMIAVTAATLLAACISYKINTPEYRDPAMAAVCEKVEEVYEVECDGLATPIAVVSKVLPWGYLGMYIPGEPYIFIAASLTGKEKFWDTKVHETVHYVLDMLKLVEDRCEHEYIARTWANEITGQPYDESWWKRYRCPKPE